MSNPTRFSPTHPLPYGKQSVGEKDVEAVIEVLNSPYLTQGPAIQAFEEAVAAYCGVPYAVAFSSGTAALHGAYAAAGIGLGDEVVTSPITFAATSNAVLYQNGTPVFADIDPRTWNLDPVATAARITPKTKALAPIHFAGQPADLNAFYQLADAHDLVVIEDACHALGGRYQGKPIGQCRDMAVFSFHPVKSITTGEGGMVVTPHRSYYEKLLQFRSHGITKHADTFSVFEGAPWEYEMQFLGYNYRITDIQAALGTAQLEKLDGFVARRQELAERYEAAFAPYPAIETQARTQDTQSGHHLFVIRLNPEYSPISRRTLYDRLVAANIMPQVHYIPVHLQPYYQDTLGTGPGDYPHAEFYYNHCLSLPLYPSLSNQEQDYVIEQVLSHFK